MDSTLVAVFDSPEAAERARQDVVLAGFDEANVGLHTELAAEASGGMLEWLKGKLHLGHTLRSSAILTVYAPPDRLAKAEETLARHRPTQLTRHAESPPSSVSP